MSVSEDIVIVEQLEKIGILRLNDPETLNSVSYAMLEALEQGLDMLLPEVRAIVLIGSGRAFSSGANLSDGFDAPAGEIDVGMSLETHVNPLMDRLRELPVPWISAVRGPAAGVGCALALAADMVVASETAYFLQAFSRIGLVPDGGCTHLLARTIGRHRTMELALLGEELPAATALTWGLVNNVVADELLETAAMELAVRLAVGPASLRSIRQMVWAAMDEPWSEMLAMERREQRNAGRSNDFAEGVQAFQEKRPARFNGR